MARHNTSLQKIVESLSKRGLPEPDRPSAIKVIPTAFGAVNRDVLKIGGIPLARITQLYGPQDSGKTISLYHIAAMAQRAFPGRPVLWLDTEQSFDWDFAAGQGVDTAPDRLVKYSTTSAERAIELMLEYLAQGVCSLIVVDSIGNINTSAALQAAAFKTDDSGKRAVAVQPGVIAKITTDAVKAVVNYQMKNETAVVFSNQVRDKIGVMFGSTEDTPGGRALKHNLHINVRTRRVGIIEDGGVPIGVRIGWDVKRNKFGTVAETDVDTHLTFYLAGGIEKLQIVDLYDRAVRSGVVLVSGSWLHVVDENGEKQAGVQGRDAFISQMLADDEFRLYVQARADAVSSQSSAQSAAKVKAATGGRRFGSKRH